MDLINHYDNIRLDEFVVMPNHFHGLIEIVGEHAVGARFIAPCASIRHDPTRAGSSGGVTGRHNQMGTNSLGEIIRYFKGRTTFEINRIRFSNSRDGAISQGAINRAPTAGSIWHHNYYERIIRDDDELYRLRQYINDNPMGWANDEHNLIRKIARAINSSVTR